MQNPSTTAHGTQIMASTAARMGQGGGTRTAWHAGCGIGVPAQVTQRAAEYRQPRRGEGAGLPLEERVVR